MWLWMCAGAIFAWHEPVIPWNLHEICCYERISNKTIFCSHIKHKLFPQCQCLCERKKNTSKFHLWHIITKFASLNHNSLAHSRIYVPSKIHRLLGCHTFFAVVAGAAAAVITKKISKLKSVWCGVIWFDGFDRSQFGLALILSFGGNE